MVKELVRRGADIDLYTSELYTSGHDTALSIAARYAHVPITRFLLKQYKARGESELQRAMHHPCGRAGPDTSLLGHAVQECERGRDRNSIAQVEMVRYLVRECGADIWRPDQLGYYVVTHDGVEKTIYTPSLPLHTAAFLGSHTVVAFSIEDCGMSVDTVSADMTPLIGACRGIKNEEDHFPLLHYLVEKKGANLTFRTDEGETAAEIALRRGMQRTYDYLTRKEDEEMAKRAAAAKAQAQLAERALTAEAAAQALVDELAAEEAAAEAAAEAKKQTKKAKKTKAKSKQARAAAHGNDVRGSKGSGGGGGDGGAAAANAAVRLSVAALTTATGSLAIGEKEEDEAQKKEEEEGQGNDMLSPPAASKAASLPQSSSTCGEDDQEEEEDDEEAFETFLHQDVPLGLQCPIGICLLTDPINAADGQTYQRAELEKWIETCRSKQQPLTLPMTKEPMIEMYFPNQYVKSHVAEFIEQRAESG